MAQQRREIAVLCGGFGGARFAPAVARAAGTRSLTVVTNPGDDVDFLGAEVWPDFDSVLYGLAGRFDEEQGWGIADDTYNCHAALGEDGWFRIGDEDLAYSLRRTEWLRSGRSPSEVARTLRELLGVTTTVVPSAANPHRTIVQALIDGSPRWLSFQEFVVRLRGQQPPRAVRIVPVSEEATPEALHAAAAGLVVIGPSNPIFSLIPILSTPGISEALASAGAVIAVSPVVTGVAPRTDPERGRFDIREKAMELFGLPHTAGGAASFLAGLVDGFVIDRHDRDEADTIRAAQEIPVLVTDLLPASIEGREALAREIVDFGTSLEPADNGRRPAGILERLLTDVTGARK